MSVQNVEACSYTEGSAAWALFDVDHEFEQEYSPKEVIVRVFEGDETALDVESMVIKQVVRDGVFSDTTLFYLYFDMKDSSVEIHEPIIYYDNNYTKLPEETQKLFIKLLSSMSYDEHSVVQDGYGFMSPNMNKSLHMENVIQGYHNILAKDFQHKNIQHFLAYFCYGNLLTFPDWFIDSVYEQEEDLHKVYQERCKNDQIDFFTFQNIISPLTSSQMIALFANRRFNFFEDSIFKTKLDFNLTTLVFQWLFNQDFSYTLNDSLENGLKFTKNTDIVGFEQILEITYTLVDAFVQESLDNKWINEEELHSVSDSKTYELLDKLRSMDKWKNLFETTQYEVLMYFYELLSKQQSNQSFVPSNVLSFWLHNCVDDYSRSTLRKTLSTYKNEIPVDVNNIFHGFSKDMNTMIVKWTDYCESNAYIPFSMFFNLNND